MSDVIEPIEPVTNTDGAIPSQEIGFANEPAATPVVEADKEFAAEMTEPGILSASFAAPAHTGRHIQAKMVDYLDEKLKGNGLVALAIKEKHPRTVFIEALKCCVGIREKTGHNDGPMVELIQSTIGGHSRESWCMSFIQTGIAYAEVKTGVRSAIVASEHCQTVWAKSPKSLRISGTPLPGAIVIWQHGKTSNGHTGAEIACGDLTMQTVEGNTTHGVSASGKIVREGGGVYLNKRSRKANGDMHVLGFLNPF